MADSNWTVTGLTEAEAKEFHSILMQSLIGFVLVSLGAHVLVWFWNPWF
jgi:light-harvesting complex 1 beta chain